MNEMYKYLKEHSYISRNKKSNYQFELSSERAECIANKYENLINDLQQENQDLKEQLENCYCNRTDCGARIKDSKVYDSLLQKVDNKQKEFIKYLEDKIYSIEPKGTGINYNCEYDSEEEYISAMKECSKLNTLKEILQKYKSIIGVK